MEVTRMHKDKVKMARVVVSTLYGENHLIEESHKMVQSLSRYTRSDLEGFYYQALNVLYKRSDKTLHIIVHDLDMAQAS